MQAVSTAERDARKREATAQARLRQANAETVRLQAQRNELQSRVRALEQQLLSAQRVNNEIFVRRFACPALRSWSRLTCPVSRVQAEKAYARYVRSVGYSIDDTEAHDAASLSSDNEVNIPLPAAPVLARMPKLHATKPECIRDPVIATAMALRKRVLSSQVPSPSLASLPVPGYTTPVGSYVWPLPVEG